MNVKKLEFSATDKETMAANFYICHSQFRIIRLTSQHCILLVEKNNVKANFLQINQFLTMNV